MAFTKEQKREWQRQRYANDPEYREKRKTAASRTPEARAAWWQANKDKYKLRNSARYKVRNRVRTQKWPDPSTFICTDCSARAEHYHHDDYSQWWNVEPLCEPCHGKRHRL